MRRTTLPVAVIVAALVIASGSLAAISAAGASGAETPRVTIDAPSSVTVDESTTATLTFDNVSDSDGVGSYTVDLTYDPSQVSISASGTSTFDVAVENPDSGHLRITGYTGDYPGPTTKGVLANLQITGKSESDATITVSVESFSDADGNELSTRSAPESLTVNSDSSKDGSGSTDPSSPPSDDNPSGDDTSNDDSSAGSSVPPSDTTTVSDETPTDESGSAEFVYSAASVNQSQVTVDSAVAASVTIENVGNASGHAQARLSVDDEFYESRRVAIDPGETTTVTIVVEFDDVGDHIIRVGDMTVGTVTVTEGSDTTLTATETPSVTHTSTGSPPQTTSTSVTGTPTGQPGFGVLAGIVALLSVVTLFRRR